MAEAQSGSCPASGQARDTTPQIDLTLNSRLSPDAQGEAAKIAPPTERDIQASLDDMNKIHDDIYSSLDLFFKAFMIASVLILIVPVYVFMHKSIQREGDTKTTFSLMVGSVALMIIGILAMKYFT